MKDVTDDYGKICYKKGRHWVENEFCLIPFDIYLTFLTVIFFDSY